MPGRTTYREGMYTRFRDIVEAWPSLREFADDIGVSENTAKGIRTRNGLPSRYWLRLVEGAARRGIPCVTLELLAYLAEDAESVNARRVRTMKRTRRRSRQGRVNVCVVPTPTHVAVEQHGDEAA